MVKIWLTNNITSGVRFNPLINIKVTVPLDTGEGLATALAADAGLVFLAPTDLDLGSETALAGFFEGTETLVGVN